MVKSLPEGCTGYQIVRCARHESDIATISQGVLSSPVSNAYSRQFEGNNDDYWVTKYHMFCPTGFLTTNKFIEGYNVHDQLVKDGKNSRSQCMTNIDNDKLLQFVSKEICYQPESFKQFTKDKNIIYKNSLFYLELGAIISFVMTSMTLLGRVKKVHGMIMDHQSVITKEQVLNL